MTPFACLMRLADRIFILAMGVFLSVLESGPVLIGLGKGKICFATLTARKSRLYCYKTPKQKGEIVRNTLVSVLSEFPPKLAKTITGDLRTKFTNLVNINIVMFPLPALIMHSKKALTKIPMNCSESFIQKKESSSNSVQRH